MSKKKKKIQARRADFDRLVAIIARDMGEGLFGRTEAYVERVGELFTAATDALTNLASGTVLDPATDVFSFSDSKRMSEKSAAILRGLYSAVYNEVKNAVITEWGNANSTTDRLIAAALGNDVRDDRRFARLFARNREAMDAFFSRKNEYGGLNLSQKVWKYTSQFKEEMELALSASLGRGDSAATVSRKVRQYLQEPDRLFRRVRDEEGNLKLSKRAAAYHPGRGEYRSSYKNAMRMTRTEVNAAYRAADCDRWSQIDFIVGVEVKRSNHPFACSVCEALAGKYPKDFKFVGWHPQCRCYIVPVMADYDQRMAYHKAVLDGEDVSGWKFDGEIAEPHEGFQKWMKDNADRVEKAAEKGTLPYWMKDNPQYVGVKQAARPEPVKDIHDQFDTSSPELRARMDAKRKYNSYGEEWEKAYFNEENGGFNVYHRSHQFSGTKASGAKMSGGEAEKHVGRTLADVSAKQVEFLPENGKSTGKPDLAFDGHTWDVKYISMANENTIRKYMEDARKADCVIFYWDEESKMVELKNATDRTIGKFRKKGELATLPSIYFISDQGELFCLFDNTAAKVSGIPNKK